MSITEPTTRETRGTGPRAPDNGAHDTGRAPAPTEPRKSVGGLRYQHRGPRSGYVTLDGDGLWLGDELFPGHPRDLPHLAECLGDLGPRPQVWIHESALDGLGLPRESPTTDASELPGILANHGRLWVRSWPPRVWACVFWFVEGGEGFDLHVPAWGGGNAPFAGLERGRDLHEAVGAWERVTDGAPWRGTGGATSDGWLRRGAVHAALPPPMTEGRVHETQLVYGRAADAGTEQRLRRCYGFDVNGAYLAVAGSIELPTGEPVHLDWPAFDNRVPGLWRVELEHPVPHLPDGGGLRWVTTPTMQQLHTEGHEAIEAWLWPKHGRHLRRWQEQLRDARARLIEEGLWASPAGQAVKQVYQHGLGRLASVRRRADPPTRDPLYQPYTDLAVIAEARRRLWARVLLAGAPGGGCQRAGGAIICGPKVKGVWPVAIYRDALYYLSSRKDHAALAGALGLRLGDGLGMWKPAGAVAGAVARELLAQGRGSMVNTVKVLAGKVREGDQ